MHAAIYFHHSLFDFACCKSIILNFDVSAAVLWVKGHLKVLCYQFRTCTSWRCTSWRYTLCHSCGIVDWFCGFWTIDVASVLSMQLWILTACVETHKTSLLAVNVLLYVLLYQLFGLLPHIQLYIPSSINVLHCMYNQWPHACMQETSHGNHDIVATGYMLILRPLSHAMSFVSTSACFHLTPTVSGNKYNVLQLRTLESHTR